MNMADALDRTRASNPLREAVICKEVRLTYAGLWSEASRVAAGLAGLGVAKGDRVCLFLNNRAEFVVAHYATMKLGAICVSLSHMLKADEVRELVNDCAAKVLITETALAEHLPPRAQTPSVQTLVGLGESGEVDCELDWEGLHSTEGLDTDGGYPTCATTANDPATIIYTSGTTGISKGVVLTHGNLVSNTQAARRMCAMGSEDVSLLFLPLSHSFGQNFILNASIQAGGTVVIQKGFGPDEALGAIKREGVTRFYAVPAIYIALLGHPETLEAMGTVTYCFSAAASMPEEVARRWKDLTGLEMHEGYGLTESTPFATYNHETHHKFGSVGTPIDNVEVQIIAEDGKKLGPGEPGEVLIKGPNIMKGYFGKPKATARSLVEGWLHTGDVGYLDEEGYLFLVDRLKDMINNAGLKVWPREVEEVLYRNAKVVECAVIGVPHEVYGETVKAVICTAPDATMSAEEVKAYLKEHLSDYKVPRLVEFMDQLPKNATGKILKRELRA